MTGVIEITADCWTKIGIFGCDCSIWAQEKRRMLYDDKEKIPILFYEVE